MGYLSGTPIKQTQVKCTKDGIPTILGPFIEEIRSYDNANELSLPLLMTILFSTRALSIGKTVDISSIIDYPAEMGVNYKD